MAHAKYIVMDDGIRTKAFVFDGIETHSDVFNRLSKGFSEILGAGFFYLHVNEEGNIDIIVFGESLSLGVKSRPEDKQYLKLAMGV